MVESDWHEKARKNLVDKYRKLDFKVESSHETKKIELFRDKISRASFLSDADIVLLKDNKIVKIIEVQQSLRPKEIIGIIESTNLCNKCKLDGKVYDLSDVELIIATKKQKEGSKKAQQMELIKDNLKLHGCLNSVMFEEVE